MERTISLPGVTLNWMKMFLAYKVANIWNSFKSELRQENLSKFAKTIRDKAVIYKHYTILVTLTVEKGVEQVLISEKSEEAKENVVTTCDNNLVSPDLKSTLPGTRQHIKPWLVLVFKLSLTVVKKVMKKKIHRKLTL